MQNHCGLTDMNSLLSSTQNIPIEHPDSTLTLGSHIQKAFIKSSFSCKYKVHVLQVCLHMRIAVYILLN